MPLFLPDQVLPHDPAGFGRWLTGHSLEHTQMSQLVGTVGTPIANIPLYDILSWSDDPARVVFWLNIHQQIHQALRDQSGVTGIDLSLVDFNDDDDFLVWQLDHSVEHKQLRFAYGLT
jgi:hypothetical protein